MRQAFGADRAVRRRLGAAGYAIRRDLSFLYRIAFWLLLACCRRDRADLRPHPGGLHDLLDLRPGDLRPLHVVDFNRLRRAGSDEAIPLAAGIFLDVLNIFLFFLRIFGRSR